MKRISLILAVMFLVFDYSWAGKKDAEKFLLNGNHANSFLVVHKRDWCSEVHRIAEENFEGRIFWVGSANVHEECCVEGCTALEMYENLLGNRAHVDYGIVRENYLRNCC